MPTPSTSTTAPAAAEETRTTDLRVGYNFSVSSYLATAMLEVVCSIIVLRLMSALASGGCVTRRSPWGGGVSIWRATTCGRILPRLLWQPHRIIITLMLAHWQGLYLFWFLAAGLLLAPSAQALSWPLADARARLVPATSTRAVPAFGLCSHAPIPAASRLLGIMLGRGQPEARGLAARIPGLTVAFRATASRGSGAGLQESHISTASLSHGRALPVYCHVIPDIVIMVLPAGEETGAIPRVGVLDRDNALQVHLTTTDRHRADLQRKG